MALFIGGPADGKRFEVDSTVNVIDIGVNPNPPGFTPDLAVLNPEIVPTYRYRKECISCGADSYYVFVPFDWTCNDVVEALVLNYRKDNTARLAYINTAEGIIYDNDDRAQGSRPYRI